MAQDLTKKGGRLAASFPVDESDQILLVTDQGQLIRTRVGQVRLAGRNTQGVTIFRTSAEEHVVSVERLADAGEDDAGRRRRRRGRNRSHSARPRRRVGPIDIQPRC